MADVEGVLRDAGYEVTEVGLPAMGRGCCYCGRDVETANGCCIRCAAKTAPVHWDAPTEEDEWYDNPRQELPE